MSTLQDRALSAQLRQDHPPIDPKTGQKYARAIVAVTSTIPHQVVRGHLITAPVNDDGEITGEPDIIETTIDVVPDLEKLLEDATAAEWKAVRKDLDWHEANKADHEEHHRHWAPSLSGSFRAIMKRDIRPFTKVEVLGLLDDDAKGAKSAKG